MVETAYKSESKVVLLRNAALLLLALILVPQFCLSESVASKNKRGNRLFEQGRYEDAEKAYLSAQVDGPGKPEILYNLGNSFVKQKKYREGIQALGQSIGSGNREIKERGWYNKGNALFTEGYYRDSANAFIQALKLNPSDRDAKHNLELALLKQQEPQKKENNQKQQDQKDSGRNGQQQPRRPNQDKGSQGSPKQQQDQSEDLAKKPAQREGSMTREQALQLLDAVQNQELEQQRKLLESRARERSNARDW